METSLKTFRAEYLDLLLGVLWRQWTALGVAGQGQSPSRHVVDPEALLLFTCSIGRYDQRLFDEMLDWLTVNGRFLNVQRMKNILHREPFQGGRVLSSVADWLSKCESPMKWTLLANTASPTKEPESLFFLSDGRPLPGPAEKDATFLAHGFVRNPVVLRGYSQAFPANTLACHVLKLRALFGVNARCDVLAYLAMNRSGHPREIAREMYYSQKAIHDAMTDMACSGFVHSFKPGRNRTFRISSSGQPFLVNEEGAPDRINWPILFSMADTVWAKIEELRTADLDPLLQSSEITLAIRPLIQRLAQAPWAPTLPALQDRQGLPLLHTFRNAFQLLVA